VTLGPFSEDIDYPTNKGPCREVDMMRQKNEDRIERTVDQKEHLDKTTTVSVGDNFGPRASAPEGAVEPRTTSGFDELTTASSRS
jgi:hypothetical protein